MEKEDEGKEEVMYSSGYSQWLFTPEKKSNTDADTFLYSWLLPACHSCKANLDYSCHVEKQAAFLSINFLQIRLKCT